jgi:hypothetical protein
MITGLGRECYMSSGSVHSWWIYLCAPRLMSRNKAPRAFWRQTDWRYSQEISYDEFKRLVSSDANCHVS